MPELPEVETVRSGLTTLLGSTARIDRVELRRDDLRAPIPSSLPERLRGQPILAVRRRAKYLLWDTPAATLLCHLGMTGTWRLAATGDERDHDHCVIHLTDGRRLVFRDPRRFGLLDVIEPGHDASHPRLRALGPEPLDATTFTGAALHVATRGRRSALKAMIMDQAVVVGVGNIYAAEALFRAGLRPTLAAGRLTRSGAERLVEAIRTVLTAAIAAGGSTISDFRQAGGDGGYFQHDFRVYGRAGSPCVVCAAVLRHAVVAGRSTVWCPRCQA